MTNEELIARLRDSKGWPTLGNAAAARLQALIAEHDALRAALAEAREKALREAAGLSGWWLSLTPEGEPDGTFCSVPPSDDPQARKYVRAERVLALIDKGESHD